MQLRPRRLLPTRRRLLAGVAALVLVPSMAACGSDDSTSTASAASSPAAAGSAASPSLAPHQEATYEYIVPAGTAVRIDAGESVELMPQTLVVKVGESIFIENQDVRDYTVGPFFVEAGQSLAMRFTRASVLSGECAFNPSGQFEIIVQE